MKIEFMEYEIKIGIANIERSNEEKKNLLELAFNCLSFLDLYLTIEEKQELLVSIGHFNRQECKFRAFKIITKPHVLEEEQIRVILDCLVDQTLRTQLVINIAAMGILKVPVDGVPVD